MSVMAFLPCFLLDFTKQSKGVLPDFCASMLILLFSRTLVTSVVPLLVPPVHFVPDDFS